MDEGLEKIVEKAASAGQRVSITTTTVTIDGAGLDVHGFYSVPDIAIAYRVGEARLRGRLGKDWRHANPASWKEEQNGQTNTPTLTFLVESVIPIINELRAAEKHKHS